VRPLQGHKNVFAGGKTILKSVVKYNPAPKKVTQP